MTIKLIVGYKTRTVPNINELIPEYWSESDKLNANNLPYTGTFDEVVLIDPSREHIVRFSYSEGRHPGGPRPSVSVGTRNWILKAYPDAWSYDVNEATKSGVIFMGFNPKLFLKMLGLECSLPNINKALPPNMWYPNIGYRDILEAVMPEQECNKLTLPIVLRCRRPIEIEAAKKWDAKLDNWQGPGSNAETDAWLTVELASQLGLLKD